MLHIRPFSDADWPAVWPLLQATIATGDTLVHAPDSTEASMYQAWIAQPQAASGASFVACDETGQIVGLYMLKANQAGLGSHVSNCGYVVSSTARGKGVAAQMCEHSQKEAVARGFKAMQFNFVVSTNTRAVALWQRMGFAVVGRLPGAFKHQALGYVDALVMFKQLVD